jgi:uncharacterized protein YcaQ
MLHELQARDRRIFEYWGHAASYLPISDYRYYIPRMRSFLEPHQKWEKHRLEKYGHMMKPVLERIREEGPLGSKDFAPPKDAKRGTWWDWRPAKVALELLFWRGELMITERRNFHRVYDLTERVLPGHVNTTEPDNKELGRFLVRRALSAYGVATESDIREHLYTADKKAVSAVLPEMVESGEVVPAVIGGLNDRKHYALADKINSLAGLKKKSPGVHLLSPFDNFIILRDRISRLFGFDYALECYTPAAKRKYGYFVLPILWGEEFAGRLDPKADRKAKTLVIQSLSFEPEFNITDTFLQRLAEKLWDFAHFNGCGKISIEKVKPTKLKKEINRLLDR